MYSPSPDRRDDLPPLDQLSLRDPARPEEPRPDGPVKLTPERFCPVSLEMKHLTPAELDSVLSEHHFPFDHATITKLVDVLYGRTNLDIDSLRREASPGLAIDVNYNRDYTVGGGKFTEERSFTMSIEPTGVGCPYIIFDLRKSEANKTGETVDLKLTWDHEMMMGLALEDTRWQPLAQTLAGLEIAADPEKYELQRREGTIDPKVEVSERISMEVSPFEIKVLTEDELEKALEQEMQGAFEPRRARLAWTPCAIHIKEPTAAEQENILSALGLSEYSKIAKVGLLDEGMNVAISGEVQDKDVFWQLYDLPTEISISERSFFGLGDPTFGFDEMDEEMEGSDDSEYDPSADESEEYDPEETRYSAGEIDGDAEYDERDEYEEADYDEEAGFDPSGDLDREEAYGHPEIHQLSIRKLPSAPSGMEIAIHGPFPDDVPGIETDGQIPYVSLDWNPTALSKADSKGLWKQMKAINAAIGGRDVLDAMVKRLPNDPYASAVTFHLDKIAVTFALVSRGEKSES